MKIAIIGSRKIPTGPVSDNFSRISYYCAAKNVILRSGAAFGSDLLAEQAYFQHNSVFPKTGTEIFIPWEGFSAIEGVKNPLWEDHILPLDSNLDERLAIVKEIHPAFNRLGYKPRLLHARNVNQVCGLYLNDNVSCVICWTESGKPIGGTATAINLATYLGIKVFNLGSSKISLQMIASFIEDVGV